MTDRPAKPDPSNGSALSCSESASMLPSYSAGTLSERAARALEWHAAHCSTCEPLLERALGDEARVRSAADIAAHVTWTDLEAATLRRRTLAQIRPIRAVHSIQREWPVGIGVLLAASLIFWTRDAGPTRAQPTSADDVANADAEWRSVPGATTEPMRSAVRLARLEAAPEFAALDTAAREIDRALAASPGDESLREFRVALDTRRRELEARVVRVTE